MPSPPCCSTQGGTTSTVTTSPWPPPTSPSRAGGGDGVAVEGARLPAGHAAGPRGLQDGLRQDGLIAMGHQLILLIILHN
jgi:hypothetical protein